MARRRRRSNRGSDLVTVLIVGAAGVGGYLLYKRVKATAVLPGYARNPYPAEPGPYQTDSAGGQAGSINLPARF